MRLDGLTNEKVSPLDVLSPSVMLGVVREITRSLVVSAQRRIGASVPQPMRALAAAV